MVNGHFIHFFDHRLDPPRPGEPLVLQLPPFDDYHHPQAWTIHSVWWGPASLLQGGGGTTPWQGGSRGAGSSGRSGRPPMSADDIASITTTQLFVGGLVRHSAGPELTAQEQALVELLGAVGSVTIKVIPDKGFGFATFTEVDHVKAAITQFNSTTFQGQRLSLSPAKGQ